MLRDILRKEAIIVPGAYNAINAIIAQNAGFRAVYISGSGVAGNMGLPDLSVTTLTEVSEECRRFRSVIQIPIIVDADTGFGETINVIRTVRELESSGAAAIHIEDQVMPKKCGHLKGKAVTGIEEMKEKIKAALSARESKEFMVFARTDSRAVEGFDACIDRIGEYIRAGADGIFPEALESEEEFREVGRKFNVPMIANMTEFGKSPLLDFQTLSSMGFRIVLFPLTAFRAALNTSEMVYKSIMENGSQKMVMDTLMTRAHYYSIIGYDDYEKEDSELSSRH